MLNLRDMQAEQMRDITPGKKMYHGTPEDVVNKCTAFYAYYATYVENTDPAAAKEYHEYSQYGVASALTTEAAKEQKEAGQFSKKHASDVALANIKPWAEFWKEFFAKRPAEAIATSKMYCDSFKAMIKGHGSVLMNEVPDRTKQNAMDH
ncbi:MAG: hypothetical protein V4735_00645 [Pseudomonadota bacterium]